MARIIVRSLALLEQLANSGEPMAAGQQADSHTACAWYAVPIRPVWVLSQSSHNRWAARATHDVRSSGM